MQWIPRPSSFLSRQSADVPRPRAEIPRPSAEEPQCKSRDPEDSNKVRVGMEADWAYFLRAIRAALYGWKYPFHEARPAGAAGIDQDRPGQRPLGPVAATKSDPPRGLTVKRTMDAFWTASIVVGSSRFCSRGANAGL